MPGPSSGVRRLRMSRAARKGAERGELKKMAGAEKRQKERTLQRGARLMTAGRIIPEPPLITGPEAEGTFIRPTKEELT